MRSADSDLKREWDEINRKLSLLRSGGASLSPQVRDEVFKLDARKASIRREWGGITAARSRGELTDETRTEQVRKIVSQLAKFNEVNALTEVVEGRKNSNGIAKWWEVRMFAGGSGKDFDPARWQRFIAKVEQELREFGFINWNLRRIEHVVGRNDDIEELEWGDHNSLESYDVEEDEEDEFSHDFKEYDAVSWPVYTWVWLGPDSER